MPNQIESLSNNIEKIEQSKNKCETLDTFLEISKNLLTLKQFSTNDKAKISIVDKSEHERIFFIPQYLCFNNKLIRWWLKRQERGLSLRIFPYLKGNLMTHNISKIEYSEDQQEKVNAILKRFIEIKAHEFKSGLMKGTNLMPTKEILITTIAFVIIICFLIFGAIIVPNLTFLFSQ